MKKIIKAIKDWYKGDDGEPEFNFVTQEYEYKRPPRRHWLAKLLAKSTRIIGVIFSFAKKEWKFLILLIFTILNFIYAHSIDDSNKKGYEEYKSCKIHTESASTITLKCVN